MSGVRPAYLLSNGVNESTKEIIDTFSTNEESFSNSSFVDNSKIQSSTFDKDLLRTSDDCYPKLNIDFDYAIELLKKEDQNINVYSHLQRIINKVLLERPENPLEKFELYSQILKRSYVPRESYFVPVFVDNINRDDCRKNLQMYKCALKMQSNEQNRYNYKHNASAKKSNILPSTQDKKTINDSNDVEVHVQNLWKVNYMFNKAGCGLPTNEVALISMAMNTMAQLNKFKNIRFWGKIFGIRNTYFIIECEWTDTELHHKILMRKNNPESSTLYGKKKCNDITANNSAIEQFSQPGKDFSYGKNENETKSSNTSQQESFTSTVKNKISDVSGEFMVSSDSWASMKKGDSFKTKRESLSSKIPDEMFGMGTNKNVYFVTNDLINTKWIELDSVGAKHVTEARKIKRYFTGKLYQPINSYPKFEGLEIDYLRAQIARISANTQICPQGYYVTDKKEINLTEVLDKKLSVPSDLSKIILVNLIQNKNFKPIPSENLIYPSYWVHKNPRIQNNGITKNSYFPMSNQSIIDEELSFDEDEENLNYAEDALNDQEELFGNLKNDISFDTMPAWKGSLCSPFDSRNSYTMMKSHIWPGACAVAYKLETDYVYIGWAQKNDYTGYCSNLISELKISDSANKNLSLYQEFIEVQNTTTPKKHTFSIKRYRKSYKGEEKVLKDYTYEQ